MRSSVQISIIMHFANPTKRAVLENGGHMPWVCAVQSVGSSTCYVVRAG